MKILPRLILLFAAMLTLAIASAADLDKFLLRGYIHDKDWKGIDSVEVTLVKEDTIKIPYKLLVSNINNKIIKGSELRALVESGMGSYTLTLYKEGYEPLIREFKIASVSEDLKMLYDLEMEKERFSRKLDEVTVTSTRVKMVMKGDTIVFDAAAFNVGEGSMLDALVRQLPGATLSTDGVIEVNGRKVNELLVNGKDFFKGDPKVALQNLPAYTVKNIKVYDKAEDDAYLTHSNAKIAKREEEENLVMNVELKKEYDTGWMANAEGGYGTDNHYLGRLFGLGYTNRLRIAVFGNVNDVGNQSNAGDSGQWNERPMENGKMKVAMTGLDYSYKDDKRIEASGNINFTHTDNDEHELASRTRFFQGGDLYARSELIRNSIKNDLSTRHEIRYKGDNLFMRLTPTFNWNRGRTRTDNLSANFSVDPIENYRGEAIDSVFDSRTMNSYKQHLLTYLQALSLNVPENYNGQLSVMATLRPKHWKGKLSAWASGRLAKNTYDNHQLYLQNYGPNNTPTDAKPVSRDNFTTSSAKSNYLNASLSYEQEFRKFGEELTRTYSFTVSPQYVHNYSNTDLNLYKSDSVGQPLLPPSAVRPETMMLDLMNSPYTRNTSDAFGTNVEFSFSQTPTSPGDSTWNPTFNVYAGATYRHTEETYDFIKRDITNQHLTRGYDFINPHASFSFSSANQVRNLYFYINYFCSKDAPAMRYLVDNTNTSDPLNIYMGATSDLKDGYNHSISFGSQRYSRGSNHAFFGFYGSWEIYTNQVAYAQRYNPVTGVTVNTPENINGNWRLWFRPSYSINVGKRKEFNISVNSGISLRNSADFVGLDSEPRRSSVFNMSYSPSLGLTYNLKNGSTITAGMQSSINRQQSKREDFNNLTWYAYWPYLRLFLKLPYDFELNTQFNPYFRRGYENKEMNTTEYVWNATATKTFGKSGFSLKLAAMDILAQAKHIYSTVNAQGRTEEWRNTMPRYVLLTAVYRFDMKPRKERQNGK